MTVQELYEYAKKNELLDYELRIQYKDASGEYYNSADVEDVFIDYYKQGLILSEG